MLSGTFAITLGSFFSAGYTEASLIDDVVVISDKTISH
jgi:hypothetical protein